MAKEPNKELAKWTADSVKKVAKLAKRKSGVKPSEITEQIGVESGSSRYQRVLTVLKKDHGAVCAKYGKDTTYKIG